MKSKTWRSISPHIYTRQRTRSLYQSSVVKDVLKPQSKAYFPLLMRLWRLIFHFIIIFVSISLSIYLFQFFLHFCLSSLKLTLYLGWNRTLEVFLCFSPLITPDQRCLIGGYFIFLEQEWTQIWWIMPMGTTPIRMGLRHSCCRSIPNCSLHSGHLFISFYWMGFQWPAKQAFIVLANKKKFIIGRKKTFQQGNN